MIAEICRAQWGTDVGMTVEPVVVRGSVEATLAAVALRELSDPEREAVRNLAQMLGQFRARLAEERQGRERLAAQRLLGDCASDLAEATPDDYPDVLRRVYSKVGAYCGLDAVFELSLIHIFRRTGDDDRARHWFAHAAELAPYDFSVRRAAMPLQDVDPFGEAFFELFGAWREAGSPYHGVPRS